VAGYRPDEQFGLVEFDWLVGSGWPLEVHISLALDGLSLWFYALTALLMVVAVLVSWEAIDRQSVLY
jgi:NADH:ubiquinone oxidoreductase subunit 4 (subunit M)